MPAVIDAPGSRRMTLSDQTGSLGIILREEFGVPFRFYQASTGWDLAPADPADRPGSSLAALREERAWVQAFCGQEQARVEVGPGGRLRLGLSLHDGGRPALVAVGDLPALARTPGEGEQERDRTERWLRSVYERVRLASQAERRGRADGHRERERERDSAQAAPAAWEAVLRLDRLMRGQKIHKDAARNRKKVLEAAAELVGVQALVFVPGRSDDPIVLEGAAILSPWDCHQLAGQLARSPDPDAAGYVVCNDLAGRGFAARFPQVRNLLALPVPDRGSSSWVIAVNKRAHRDRPDGSAPGVGSGSDAEAGVTPSASASGSGLGLGVGPAEVVPFRRMDAALLTPFVSLLGFHARASQSYRHLRELLVGLTRSLTAAIDAKDSYTYGHSERVARVAVELGRELGLSEEELSDIYLTGLLHDIGKIGIRDEVLGKRGPLTPEEFEHIKEHVTIGYKILADLKAIGHLLPGVLYHHERYDGKGYPEGLKGTAIPFIARILAVADSFDAMSTSRPYRQAMPPAKVEQVLIEGAGTQWEKAVVDAFVRAKDRIHAIRQRGLGESLSGALDDALNRGHRHPDRSSHLLGLG